MTGLLLTLLTTAHAGVLATYGGGEVGNAGNAGATVSSPMAAWNNPAAMRTPRIEESVEWLHGEHRFYGNGQKLPVTPDAQGLVFGAVVNGYWFRVPAINIGVAAYMPMAGPYSWLEEPEGKKRTDPSPQVPRFSDELNRLDLAVSGNIWLTPWLSLGAGIDAASEVETLTVAQVDDIDKPEEARKAQDVSIRPTFHPFFGLVATAGQSDTLGFRLALVARTAREMHDFGESSVKLLLLDAIYKHDYTRHQAPRTATVGTALSCPANLCPVDLDLRTDVTYAAWSEVVGPYSEDLGKGWRDTVSIRLGLEASWDKTALQLGHGFDPGPLDHIPAGTIYLDAPSRIWTAGLSQVIAEPGARDVRVLFGLHRTRFQPGIVPDPSGREHLFGGHLTAVRLGLGIGHPGHTSESQ